MKFFLPDAQDLVDPSFNFETERRSPSRERHRDDLYAHEIFSERPFDGYLISKGIVDGYGGQSSRYSLAQRHRFSREGAHRFLRTERARFGSLEIMGDCGAFTYVREPEPPYSVSEVLDFYEEGGFDLGISVDHVILEFNPEWDTRGKGLPAVLKRRRELTIELARDFLKEHRARRSRFKPLGVAQGWSPKSYARSVSELQKIGYDYIAVGGMVPLKTPEIVSVIEYIATVRQSRSRLHLLGVTRMDAITGRAHRLGVASFDSTSPLRQAFKDDTDNYYTDSGTYTAIRIPQIDANPSIQRRIGAGQIRQETARDLERRCLGAMRRFDTGEISVDDTLAELREYEQVFDPKADHSAEYRRTLSAAPWRACACDVCRKIGYHVILFRGAERNRRRGLHNVWTFYRRLRRLEGESTGARPAVAAKRSAKRGQPPYAEQAEP